MPPIAAQPPIVVNVNAFLSPDLPVLFPANHPVVSSTAFLKWTAVPAAAVGAAQVKIPTYVAVRAFGRRLHLAAQAQFQGILPGPLEVCFSSAAWTRIMRELCASGLTALGTFSSFEQLYAGIDGLTLANPANLIIGPGDFAGAEPLAAVAPVYGQPAAARPVRSGSQQAQAQAPVPQPGVLLQPGRPALHSSLSIFDPSVTTIWSSPSRSRTSHTSRT